VPTSTVRVPLRAVWASWRRLVGLGVVLMVSGMIVFVSHLLLRALVVRELGLDAAGHFQASWTISTQYIGFLMTAMAADYFPRLSRIIDDRPVAHALVDDQTQVGLAVGGPILVGLIGVAPWAIPILFSSAFMPAAELLQWQCLGNVLRLAAFPLAFVLMAQGRSGTYLAAEVAQSVMLVAAAWILLPSLGLLAAAVAFILSNATHLLALLVITYNSWGYTPGRQTASVIAGMLAVPAVVLCATLVGDTAALIAATMLGVGTAAFSGRIVAQRLAPHGEMGRRLRAAYARVGWAVREAALR
jgi:PST family polysaccharide transporter